MKNTNIILLIVLCIIGIANLLKIFTIDHNLKDSKTSLKEAQKEMNNVKKLNTQAQEKIKDLKTVVEKFELKNQKLQLEIDSIGLLKRAKAPIDWEDRQNIKKKQQEITDRLTKRYETKNHLTIIACFNL